jgi:hypothetical protein
MRVSNTTKDFINNGTTNGVVIQIIKFTFHYYLDIFIIEHPNDPFTP